MNYGLPYMGSKNFIAEWVLSKIPPRTNFYDLFCGGGAITHAALLAKKHRRFFMNDLNPFSALFFDAVSGKYHNEKRWVSRVSVGKRNAAYCRQRQTMKLKNVCLFRQNN